MSEVPLYRLEVGGGRRGGVYQALVMKLSSEPHNQGLADQPPTTQHQTGYEVKHGSGQGAFLKRGGKPHYLPYPYPYPTLPNPTLPSGYEPLARPNFCQGTLFKTIVFL